MAMVLSGTLKKQQAPSSTEEDDILVRSSKKIKNVDQGNEGTNMEIHWPKPGETPSSSKVGGPSFMDKLKGTCNEEEMRGTNEINDDPIAADATYENLVNTAEQEKEDQRCKITESSKINFPSFSSSTKMKNRLYKAWSTAVIVKLLGRNIGFRALEKRLQVMWAKRGILTLINIGHGYFVVKFTNKDDFSYALTGGPWLIYDHYLTVKPWEANFRPEKAVIDKAAVWVRIPKLPLEFHDEEALTLIGNRIGKTIKVDMNTSCQLRGQFARICVLIELGKQMMRGCYIEGEEFFLEYEGLHLQIFFSLPLKEWMILNLAEEVGKDKCISWSQIWGVAIWFLWLWRNRHIFSEDFQKPSDPAGVIIRSWKLFCFTSDSTKETETVNIPRWVAPPVDWVKLNTDGAVITDGPRSGCGGVIRSANGHWQVGFFQQLGRCGAYEAEEWGMLLGLRMAWEEGFKRLIVESDSKILVDRLMVDTNEPSCSSVFIHIRNYLSKDWEVQVKFISRLQNKLADALAKEGLSSSAILPMCPINLRTVLSNDCMGLDPLILAN